MSLSWTFYDRPLRDIILNRDDLVQHALEIARLHVHSGKGKVRKSLIPRVQENMRFLKNAHAEITQYVEQRHEMVPAAEWFLDNYYLIKDLRLEIMRNLPRSYEKELTSIAAGVYEGLPRVYSLMVELVEHTDSQLQREVLKDFINSYQSEIPLSSGELWALPIMLRIVLIENIRRLAEQILYTQKEREAADQWLNPFFNIERNPEEWEEALAKSEPLLEISPAFAERLVERMREWGVDGLPLWRWLDKTIGKQDVSMDELARSERQRQAMCQVSMGYSITSLRVLAEENWPRFFEEVSPVQKVLEQDPSGVYSKMDFASRDVYRHEIEKLARRFKISELKIAREIIERAQSALNKGEREAATHIGYSLIGADRLGLEAHLEQEWGSIHRFWCVLRRWVRTHPEITYFGGMILFMLLLGYPFLSYVFTRSTADAVLVTGLALLIPLSSIAVTSVNWLVAQLLTPAFLPKLDLSQGIGPELRTIVVVPTLLPSTERVQELLDQLHVNFLANQDPHLHFALLGDFTDAPAKEMPDDQEILQSAIEGIKALNAKYGPDRFFLLHRERLWNSAEGVWMGWERKRGKLIEFNKLLQKDEATSYSVRIGELNVLSKIRYVITLDSDTQLPRGSAHRLIGTMAHPLHKPVLSPDKRRVVEGYALMQPRIGVSIPSTGASFFARVFAGKGGVDPYTTAVSDVYQDLFGEGSFTGKGIYDAAVFHQVTAEVFPENTILSHDLIEGIYARTALVTDIELVDGFPSKVHAYMRRLHRWVRGDWQISPWIFQPLKVIARWKIFDNLRRSLEAPAQLVLIFLAFTVLPGNPWLWVGFVGLNLLWPVLLHLLTLVAGFQLRRQEFKNELEEMVIQAGLNFLFLPYTAYIELDAAIRSLIRQHLTHRKMLEWETAAAAERRLDLKLRTSWRLMGPSLAGVILYFILALSLKTSPAWQFTPLALLWLSSPWIAYRISLPNLTKQETLTPKDQQSLRRYALKIWVFFQDYINREENWLPPDNVQINPPNGVAHRTSPTNMGLALLANLAARELGYISLNELYQRVDHTLSVLEKLDRWRGHFYNWYDTRKLSPLPPQYVSTVDSGNLVVYFLTLKNGLEETLSTPVISSDLVQGLQDCYQLVKESLKIHEVLKSKLHPFTEGLRQIAQEIHLTPRSWYELLLKWPLGILAEAEAGLGPEGVYWVERLERMIQAFRLELEGLYPWLSTNPQELPSELNASISLLELEPKYRSLSESGSQEAKEGLALVEGLLAAIRSLQHRLNTLTRDTDFTPLYDQERQLFSIGYRLADGTLDKSYYDLLASEARQASFIAIARGDIPQSHWFRLGRSMTRVHGHRTLVSWSGTMFEFLMPLLVMRNYEGTLLDETYASVVKVQERYGEERKVPWGISESGFYAFDAHLNYQYKAFGVPGLGLKRGLKEDLVIAPYASFLALMVSPVKALGNLKRMEELGFGGRYGLYEAVDYTDERVPAGREYRVVQSYMAHHQGMSLLALTNVLTGNSVQRRFHAEAMVQATELILQERLPAKNIFAFPEEQSIYVAKKPPESFKGKNQITLSGSESKIPVTHFLSNGEYSVMLTNAGSGYSRWQELALSRWRSDVTRDHWGLYFYIQNLNSGVVWSATMQPLGEEGQDYQVNFAPDRAEFCRKDGNITTKTEIVVSPEDQVEIRRLCLTNHSGHDRILEITSYFEVVLAGMNEDIAHPVFGNLFIETEFYHQALLASRRPRRDDQSRPWLMHSVAVEGESIGALQYETDRARFVGRGRNLKAPLALEPNHPLTNTTGAVLDPIMSLRQRVRVKPGQTVKVSFAVGVAESRAQVISLAEKYRDPAAVNRAFELTWTHTQMELRHLNLSPAMANLALIVGGQLLYLSPERREASEYLTRNRKGQSSLWPYAISGDLPVVLAVIQESDHLALARQLLTIHEYWRLKGLKADLVFLNEDPSGYVEALNDSLRDLILSGHAQMNSAGGVFLLKKDNLSPEDITLLHSVAALTFSGREGSAALQLRRKGKIPFVREDKRGQSLSKTAPSWVKKTAEYASEPANHGNTGRMQDLIMANGYGGFSSDGREYVIELAEGKYTPSPWLNVIANPHFGFQVSESGSGYTWSQNSRENKLTPWSNDPILDPHGEAIYLRDEETGAFWSPTPGPVRGRESYRVRHGQGYTVFEHFSHGLQQELLLFVPMDAPLKIIRLKLTNDSPRKRAISVFYYTEWVLGVAREFTAPYIVTEFDDQTQALFARNSYQEEFAGRSAFLGAAGSRVRSYTGDRTEFIGRNRSLSDPQALHQLELGFGTGAGYDPCAALQLEVTLEPGTEKTVYFLLGESENLERGRELLHTYQEAEKADSAYREVREFWDGLLNTVQVETPDPAMNILLNRWLLYQTVVCRLWARSAFYQAGGAFGFRDQLQDVMALVLTRPDLTRAQIIRHAGRQFLEGDVQHWWHPEKGKGIRTKFSDDLLWLPYVTSDYLEHTGDYAILDEDVPFLEQELLGEEEDERYAIPKVSGESGSVYEHCVRAIEHSLRWGEHGLPLIGTGDWNDGFSAVGREGKGESVWLAWFLVIILTRFASVCERRKDLERTERYRDTARFLLESIEHHGWDGGWYRRAYFDDGTPMGSRTNEECQIDAIAQSWAALSGLAKPSRISDAMLALEHYLLKQEDGILLLLTPPFDRSKPDPGYIKGYVPGVRENGGQYTHGAIWAILAFTAMGEGEKAYNLFRMLNPINHARTESEASRYKTEPYVMAADVYAIHPHVGRGGWSWYTGAAGWMYTAALEGILGFMLTGDKLTLKPCLPKHWPGYRLTYRYHTALYHIQVENPNGKMIGVSRLIVDGKEIEDMFLTLLDDGCEHEVKFIM
ncbi:GH36-type glycosyl hydrolase domain-containing protein [Paradesulfitobacterium ferrireducens]|uniref:GH36-type glycosyl hydrolase domain-containing protein n=1 Tax=Paradesulfitobacterium ferrireducens TaxID=2816476 RepID=UPI001A8FD926|nr:glucoamylase family protein [Paradesulfitobacterium ferrireducens]